MLRFWIASRRPQIRVSAGISGILSRLVEFSLRVVKYCCISGNYLKWWYRSTLKTDPPLIILVRNFVHNT